MNLPGVVRSLTPVPPLPVGEGYGWSSLREVLDR